MHEPLVPTIPDDPNPNFRWMTLLSDFSPIARITATRPQQMDDPDSISGLGLLPRKSPTSFVTVPISAGFLKYTDAVHHLFLPVGGYGPHFFDTQEIAFCDIKTSTALILETYEVPNPDVG
jgi:hypothetical protein